jgi:hypothetical protein
MAGLTLKACPHCDRNFYWDTSLPGSQKIYCSRRCKEEAHHARTANMRSFRARARARVARGPRHCYHCGEDISWRYGQAKWCSAECYEADHPRLQRKQYEPRACALCSAQFMPKNIQQRFCSQRCAGRKIAPPLVRRCELCFADISHRHILARYCCNEHYWVAVRERRRQDPIRDRAYKDKHNARCHRRYVEEQGAFLAVRRLEELLKPPKLPTPSPPARNCIQCGEDINNRHGRAKYCFECSPCRRSIEWIKRNSRTRLKRLRACLRCGHDISNRHGRARYCVDCVLIHKREHDRPLQRARGHKQRVLRRGAYLAFQNLVKSGVTGLIETLAKDPGNDSE